MKLDHEDIIFLGRKLNDRLKGIQHQIVARDATLMISTWNHYMGPLPLANCKCRVDFCIPKPKAMMPRGKVMGHNCSYHLRLSLRLKEIRSTGGLHKKEIEVEKWSFRKEELQQWALEKRRKCFHERRGNIPKQKEKKSRKVPPSQTILAISKVFRGSSTNTSSSRNTKQQELLSLKSDNLWWSIFSPILDYPFVLFNLL